jgi:hypothetical protein
MMGRGGIVPKSDSVFAVSKGEYEVDAATLTKYGPKLLDAINNGHNEVTGRGGCTLTLEVELLHHDDKPTS